jgi:hypothetical protein
MTYENIKLKKHDMFGEGEKESVIDPFLKSFIEKLALKYPQWVFEEANISTDRTNKVYEAYRFNVVDKREVLGTIDKEYIHSGGGYRYCVDNHRINGVRERGRGMKTIHEDKAIKHVGKFFGKKNVNEKFTEATQIIGGALGHIHNQKRWDLSHKWDALENHAQKFIHDNYAMFVSAVEVTTNKVKDNLEKLPSAIAEFSSVDAMQEALRLGDAYIVFIDGVNYSIQKGKDPLEIKTSEELPDFMRRAVGLLKLVEDNQVIDGVGVRASETTFLVMPNNVS